MKTVERFFVYTALIILTGLNLASFAEASSAFSNMSSAGFRIVNGGMSSIGGRVSSTGNTLLATNMYPYQQDLTSADFEPIYNSANTMLAAGASFRDSLALYQNPPVLPGETGLGKLLKYPAENYETVAGLLDGLAAAELNLINARDIYAYGVSIGYPGARENLTTTLKALAGIYLTIADEFLIDALDFRFSWSAGPTFLSEDRLLEQICKLGLGKSDPQLGCQSIPTVANNGAQYYYQKAMESFVYGFYSSAMGRDIHISDYFDEEIFGLFNLTVERLAATLREKSAKQFAKGMSPIATVEAEARKNVGDTVKGAYITSYLLGAAIANEPRANFVANGGDGLVSALNRLKNFGNVVKEGSNPLGYDDRFIPMQDADKFLSDAQAPAGPIQKAAQYENNLRLNQRDFDANLDQLKTAVSNIYMSDSTGGYKQQLASLTGVSITDPDFLNKVSAAGYDLYDCKIDFDNQAFEDCMQSSARTGGVLKSKYNQIREAHNNVSLAMTREQNHRDLIALEQAKHITIIEIENINKTENRDTLLNYLKEMKKSRTVERVITKEKGKDKEERTVTSFSVDYKQLGLNVNKEIDLQNQLSDYRIKQFDAEDGVTIKNYINQLAERIIETGAAIHTKNSTIDDFDSLLKDKDNYVHLYKKAINNINELNTATIEKIKEDVSRLRIMQSQDAINLSIQLNSAVHSVYLAAKALEYWYMTPLKNISLFNGSQYLNISDLYKVQTVDDLTTFIGKLNNYNTCPWGSVQSNQIQISLARDILNIKDEEPDRNLKFQQSLETLRNNANNSIRFSFSTALNDRYISKWGLYNLKIWHGSLPSKCDQSVTPKGIAVYFSTRQTGVLSNVIPRVALVQKGSSTFLKFDSKLHRTQIAEYIPVSKYLNISESPNDPSDITYTIGRFNAIVNADPNYAPASAWSNSFKGRSVASANWEMVVEDLGSYPIDWNKVNDIVIYIDTVGNPLPLF